MGLRPPNNIASIGTPLGSSHAGSITLQFEAGAQNLEFGWDDFVPLSGVHSLPSQSVTVLSVKSISFSSPRRKIKFHRYVNKTTQ